MKRIIQLFPMVLLVLVSCTHTITSTSYNSNAADFFVVNLSTGETVHNGGMVTHIEPDTVWMAPNDIKAKYNDVIRLVYQPPQRYERSSYNVSFKGSGSSYSSGMRGWICNWSYSHYGTAPYEKEITISYKEHGVIIVNCEARADVWTENSSDYGILHVIIEDSE